VSSFAFDEHNKTVKFITSQKSGGENPVYVSIHRNGKWLVNANYTGGSASVYSVNEDGGINPAAQVFTYTDSSINKQRQDHSHVHSAVFSPDYDYVFFPDLGADKIRCYHFDSLQTQPLQAATNPFTKTTLGSGPRHITFSSNEKFAYCTEEMTATITVYKYENGNLYSIQRIDAHSKKYKDNFGGSDIHISPDGRFLYASNRGDENDIAIFSIQANGTLQLVGHQSVLGNHPRNFAIDPTGKFLIVANQISGNIVVFNRDFETGLLKKTGDEVKVFNPSCVKVFAYAE
jgi:6-phosphogluconolactonase (cycloisomerase 2 family)